MKKESSNYYLVVLDSIEKRIYKVGSFTLLSSARIAKEYFEKGLYVCDHRKEFFRGREVRVINKETKVKWEELKWIH